MGRKRRCTRRRQRGGYDDDAPPPNLYQQYVKDLQLPAKERGVTIPNIEDILVLKKRDWIDLRRELHKKFHPDKYQDKQFANKFTQDLNRIDEYIIKYFEMQGGKRRRRKTRRH